MKPETEITSKKAACKLFPSLRSFECSHCRFPTTLIETPSREQCSNLRSAWSQEILTYADGSLIPIIVDPYRCYCSACLADRARPTPPTRYQGSKRRCRICGAVDSVPYPKFLLTLKASKRTEICELFRGLCNRPACERSRRFSGEIPVIAYYPYGKESYPSGYADEDVPVHWTLVDWATNPLPSDSHKLIEGRCWPRPPIGAQDERTTADFWQQVRHGMPAPSAPLQLDFGDPPIGERYDRRIEAYKTETGEWKTRVVIGETFNVVGNGTRKSSPLSGLKADRLRKDYNNDPKTLLEHHELMRTGTLEPRSRVNATGRWLWIVVGGLNPTLEEIMATQFDEKYRQKHPDKDDKDYLPPAVAYGETVGGAKESDESHTDFYVRWADKLNPAGWNWQEATPEQKATILGNPEFKRALYQMLITTGAVRVNELEPEKNPNTMAQWVRRELQNPLDSITDKNMADCSGRIGILVILNNRATVKVIVSHDAPMTEMSNILNGEKAKSIRTATKNAKQDAKRDRLGKRATKDAIYDVVRRVEQAYNDAADTIKFLHANSNTTNELAAKQDADVTFPTISEGE